MTHLHKRVGCVYRKNEIFIRLVLILWRCQSFYGLPSSPGPTCCLIQAGCMTMLSMLVRVSWHPACALSAFTLSGTSEGAGMLYNLRLDVWIVCIHNLGYPLFWIFKSGSFLPNEYPLCKACHSKRLSSFWRKEGKKKSDFLHFKFYDPMSQSIV
jgi:hypothetical protein